MGWQTEQKKALMENVCRDFLEFLKNVTLEPKYLFNLHWVTGGESMENVTPSLLRNEVKRAGMKPILKSNCYPV